MRSGYAVLGDTQHLPGYCVLLSNVDGADHLTDLPRPARFAFLADMAMLGEAVLVACRAADPGFLRVNYEILGNYVHRLHGHVHARYEWEPEEYRIGRPAGDQHRLAFDPGPAGAAQPARQRRVGQQ